MAELEGKLGKASLSVQRGLASSAVHSMAASAAHLLCCMSLLSGDVMWQQLVQLPGFAGLAFSCITDLGCQRGTVHVACVPWSTIASLTPWLPCAGCMRGP